MLLLSIDCSSFFFDHLLPIAELRVVLFILPFNWGKLWFSEILSNVSKLKHSREVMEFRLKPVRAVESALLISDQRSLFQDDSRSQFLYQKIKKLMSRGWVVLISESKLR